GDIDGERGRTTTETVLVEEQAAAAYIDRALSALLDSGCTGALVWCHADYVPEIWQRPPLDVATHERSFGMWRADGSPKPVLSAVGKFAALGAAPRTHAAQLLDDAWIDVDPATFYRAPGSNLPRLYRRYCEARLSSPAPPPSR